MTVGQYITKLQALPPELDCYTYDAESGQFIMSHGPLISTVGSRKVGGPRDKPEYVVIEAYQPDDERQQGPFNIVSF